MTWLAEWPDHDWQVWGYSVSHGQLHLRAIPMGDPGGPCIELLFKPVYRIATSAMSWSGLRVGLRRVTLEGNGVFVLVGTRFDGNSLGHGVVHASSLHVADGGLRYFNRVVLDRVVGGAERPPWQRLWSKSER